MDKQDKTLTEQVNLTNTNNDDENINYDDTIVVLNISDKLEAKSILDKYCADNDIRLYQYTSDDYQAAIEQIDNTIEYARSTDQLKLKFYLK